MVENVKQEATCPTAKHIQGSGHTTALIRLFSYDNLFCQGNLEQK